MCMGNIENVAAIPLYFAWLDRRRGAGFSGLRARWDSTAGIFSIRFAPKPMLIWPSDRDFYSTYSSAYFTNGWQEFQKLRAAYAALNHDDRLKWADTPLPHSLAYDSRLLIYNWFTRWLKGSTEPVREEPPVNPEPFATLYATESGSVVTSLHSETAFTLNKARQVERTPAALDRCCACRGASLPRGSSRDGKSPNMTVEVLEVAPDPSVWLPAWVISAKDTATDKPVLVVLDAVAAERLWFQPDADLAAGSPVVCAVDIRGVGALLPEYGPGHVGYAASHRSEEDYAWGSLILGKPLVGQRVTDILAVTAALRRHPATKGRRIRLAAEGELTVPALFAAALDKEIEAVYLSGGLTSFRDVVSEENYNQPLGNFVPGLLNHTDLPEVAATVAPRRIVVAGAAGARGETADVASVRQQYTSDHVTVEPDAKWTAERLIAFANG